MNRMESLAVCFAMSVCSWFAEPSAAQSDPLKPPAIDTQDVPVVPPQFFDQLGRYQSVRRARFRDWAPDGRGILVQTQFGNTTQLHRVYQPGGRRDQVTFFNEPTDGQFIPGIENDGALLVSLSKGGNENNQVYLVNSHEKQPLLLTDGKSRNLLGPVRPDGLFFVVASNRRNGRDTDLYSIDPNRDSDNQLLLKTKSEYWIPQDWSSDGTQLLINRYVSINESYPAVLDIQTGDQTPIVVRDGSKGLVSYGTMKFTPDGSQFYITSDGRSEFRQLYRCRLEDGATVAEPLTSGIKWGVEEVAVDHNSPAVAFTTNEHGRSNLYLLVGKNHAQLDVPSGIIGDLKFSPSGKSLGFTLSRATQPPEAYSLDLPTGELHRWTVSELGGLDAADFVEPKLITYPTFDDREIPAYYFRPRTASKEEPSAVVIRIHGGPESMYRPYFSTTDQFFVNELGMAVVSPNVRGSKGYGKTYLRLDNAEKREDSVKDIGALLDWIAKQPELDASRVAVYGGSYGGYMVLGSLTNFPDRIKAGVDIVGIASFTTFLKNTSAYRRDLRRAEYGDERIPKMQAVFDRINPTSNADKIRSALYVAHGVNDPRVPYSEAVQIVKKVRANGHKVWTVYANNEGHGFRKKDNRDYVSATIALFLKQHLGLHEK